MKSLKVDRSRVPEEVHLVKPINTESNMPTAQYVVKLKERFPSVFSPTPSVIKDFEVHLRVKKRKYAGVLFRTFRTLRFDGPSQTRIGFHGKERVPQESQRSAGVGIPDRSSSEVQ